MKYASESIEKLTDFFASMPSIGRKTAQRLTFHILRKDFEFAENFAKAMIDLKNNVKLCSICYNYTEIEPCPICSSNKRKRNIICVVEEPTDVLAIEKTNEFFGLYHVLHGVLNPLEGIQPNDIKIKELISRMIDVEEVIMALNPSIEGEATTQYIAKFLKTINVKVTRLASGIPMGSTLEYSDDATLSKALECRVLI
jgi:recombination protein RecR